MLDKIIQFETNCFEAYRIIMFFYFIYSALWNRFSIKKKLNGKKSEKNDTVGTERETTSHIFKIHAKQQISLAWHSAKVSFNNASSIVKK